MAEVKIITGDSEEKKEPDREDIKETLEKADEYQKLKEENDKFEAEIQRREDIKAKITLGGRGEAGQVPIVKTQDDIDKEEAQKMIDQFNPDA